MDYQDFEKMRNIKHCRSPEICWLSDEEVFLSMQLTNAFDQHMHGPDSKITH